jgi:hypothetical protein
MTISVGRGKPRVIITNPDLVPDFLCRIVREPSKTAIAEALKNFYNAEDIPGVTLGNPQPFLTIHRG